MSNWREPITDRTIADVRNYDAGSLDYQKGALNADDLNRIEDNYKYLMAKLKSDAIFIPHRLRNFTETVLEYVQVEEPGLEYMLVEYLESDGAQYIDTGVILDSDSRIVLDIEVLKVDAACGLYGARISQGKAGFYSFSRTSGTEFTLGYGDSYIYHNVPTSVGRFMIDHNGSVVSINGESVGLTAATFVCDYTAYLMAVNTKNSPETYLDSCRLYSCRIYDNGALVRDYIPVRDKDGVACLYDKVEEKYYYNVGTGEFSAPTDSHREVEYIESSGTQYIDSGIIGKSGITVETKVALLDIIENKDLPLIASHDGTNRIYMLYYYNVFSYGYGAFVRTSKSATEGWPYTVVSVMEEGKQRLAIDGEVVADNAVTTSYNTNLPMYIFGGNYSGVDKHKTSAKIYYLKMYQDGVLVRDFIPVIDHNGEACLYDRLNHTYYRNKGTGVFTAGAEVERTSGGTIYGYEEITTIYTDWQEHNLPWLSEINRIRANYNALVRLFLVGLGFPEQKESNYLDYIEVNNWEKFALTGKTIYENMEKEYIPCGTMDSGGGRLL